MRRALVLLALVACSKKAPRDETVKAIAATVPPGIDAATDSAPDAAIDASEPAVDAAIAGAPSAPFPRFGHYCAKTRSGSHCVPSEADCKQLAPTCGLYKSVFCFTQPGSASCFSSAADCKAAHEKAKKTGQQLTSECEQHEG